MLGINVRQHPLGKRHFFLEHAQQIPDFPNILEFRLFKDIRESL